MENLGFKANIAQNSLIIFSSKIIVAFLLFLSGVILAREFGPEGKGIYDLFRSIIALTVACGAFGIGTASIYLLNRKKREFTQLFSNSLILGIFWGVILASLIYIFFIYFPSLVTGLTKQYILLLLLVIPFTLSHAYLLPFFLAKFQVTKWSILTILHAALIFLGITILVLILNYGISGAIYAIAFSSFFTFLLVLFFLLKLTPFRFHFDRSLFREETKFGLKVYLGDIFTIVNFKLNLFIVNFFLGINNVGYYSIALNLAMILFFISYSFRQTLYPVWSLSEKKEVDKNTPRLARQVLILGTGIALFLFLIGKYFIIFVYGKEFYPSILSFYLILPGAVFMIFASIFFNNFFAQGKPHIASLILFSALIFNILLAVILVPLIGIIGAAIASSLSYFLAAILALSIFSKITNYPIKEMITIRTDDFRLIYDRFYQLFRSKKMLKITPDLTLEKLKSYYEKKALEFSDIINLTFKSSSVHKKFFYSARFNKAMELLEIKPKNKILEIGCGPGYYTKEIASKTSNLVATDLSQNSLNKVKTYNPYKIIDYVCCPAEKLPFADNSFDKILMTEVIEHLLDWDKGLREAQRVLKPGGKMIISTPNKYCYLNLLYHLKITIESPLYGREHIKEFSKKEFKAVLRKYFIIERFCYVNYFPFYLPKFLLNKIGFQKINRAIQNTETLLNKIPIVKNFGFIIIARVTKLKN